MKMNKLYIVGAAFVTVLLSGCGKRMEWNEDRTTSVIGANIDRISLNYADALYQRSYVDGFGAIGPCRPDLGNNTACSMRKAALQMSREIWTYTFQSYIALDGVSGVLYNVGYLCSVPHKIVRGLFCMDGLFCYAGALFKLALGSVCAVIGIFASPVINTICHPFATLANLTVGLVCIFQSEFGLTYTKYIFHTNIIASLIDLIWGAIIYPLLQTVLFWL